MAKPPITDLPPVWGDAGNYPAGVYSALLPWGAANPLAGQPLPWGNQPRLNATALTAFASAGAEPQVPQDASSMNEWLRRVQVHVAWVQDGSDAADATAHIMETTAAGLSRAVAYEATAGYQGAGATPAIMLMGFAVPAGETSTFGDNTTITLGANASVTGPSTASITAGTVDTIDDAGTVNTGVIDFYTQTGAPPTTNGALAYGGRDNLTVGDGGTARLVAIPIEEYVAGPVNTGAAIADTGASIAIVLAINDVVYIELDLEAENTNALNEINVRIEVNAVIEGGTRQYRPAVANRLVAVRRVVKYTAAASAVYTVTARHGASGGTTTSTNIRLLIRQANAFA